MRVCQVMLAKGFGGAERYFVDLSLELARRGHNVLAVCHPRGMARERLGQMAGLEIATISSLGTWDPFVVNPLRSAIERFQPDVVQAHLARAAHLVGKALKHSRLPLLTMTHNYVGLKYYRRVDMFLPATQDQATYLRNNGIDPENMRIIPNFSALTLTTPPADRPTAIVSLGRFVEKKGFQVLLAALGNLRRRGVVLPPVLLGGDGPLRQELERTVRQQGIEDVVRFEGWQTEPAAFLDRGTLFILPSLHEPFGIVVLEAMARGLPIIATTTQGPREVLDATCAMLVPPGDSEALAQALMQCLAQPEAARDRARRAAEYFRSRYAAESVVPQLLAVYAELSSKSA